jgi:uncharacterized protein
MKKIVITGASGFIGQYLTKALHNEGYQVITTSLRKPIPVEDLARLFTGSDIVINLCGKSVDCRYHAANKKAILTSRIHTTELIGRALSSCSRPPSLWINAGTATIYRDERERPNSESNGLIGEGFSVNVAKEWESAFFGFETLPIRMVVLRMGIVLGSGGGALPPLLMLSRMGLGGKQGDGRQMMSWIHIDDVKRAILFVMHQPSINGVVNLVAPHAVSNRDFMRILRKSSAVPFGIPLPRVLLEMGAFMIRTETELLLKSRWVYPEKLLSEGFAFTYERADKALADLIQ